MPQLNFEAVPTVPGLKVIREIASPAGATFQVVSTNQDKITFTRTDPAAIAQEVQLTGPSITTAEISLGDVLDRAGDIAGAVGRAAEAIGQILAPEGGGSGGSGATRQECTQTITATYNSAGVMTGFSSTTTCRQVPQ